MKVYYSDHYYFPLPAGHHFPKSKYALLHQQVLNEGILTREELVPSPVIPAEALCLVHTWEYYQAVMCGRLEAHIERQIGIPWSPQLAMRSLVTAGGTLAAAEEALENRIGGNLAGGTHHAMPDQGNGYCVFNDIAIAARQLLDLGRVERVAIVDLDAHQGNGTAKILKDDPRVFILDMFCAKGYPYRKVPASLNIPLANQTGDAEYIGRLKESLMVVLDFRPQILFFQAGVDGLFEDRLGNLGLTLGGLAQRDRLVIEGCNAHSIPLVLTCGGGYAEPIDLTVDAYTQTYRIAKAIYFSEFD